MLVEGGEEPVVKLERDAVGAALDFVHLRVVGEVTAGVIKGLANAFVPGQFLVELAEQGPRGVDEHRVRHGQHGRNAGGGQPRGDAAHRTVGLGVIRVLLATDGGGLAGGEDDESDFVLVEIGAEPRRGNEVRRAVGLLEEEVEGVLGFGLEGFAPAGRTGHAAADADAGPFVKEKRAVRCGGVAEHFPRQSENGRMLGGQGEEPGVGVGVLKGIEATLGLTLGEDGVEKPLAPLGQQRGDAFGLVVVGVAERVRPVGLDIPGSAFCGAACGRAFSRAASPSAQPSQAASMPALASTLSRKLVNRPPGRRGQIASRRFQGAGFPRGTSG